MNQLVLNTLSAKPAIMCKPRRTGRKSDAQEEIFEQRKPKSSKISEKEHTKVMLLSAMAKNQYGRCGVPVVVWSERVCVTLVFGNFSTVQNIFLNSTRGKQVLFTQNRAVQLWSGLQRVTLWQKNHILVFRTFSTRKEAKERVCSSLSESFARERDIKRKTLEQSVCVCFA